MHDMILSQIQYVQPGVATIPLLKGTIFFSWGIGSPNMSFKYGDTDEVWKHQKEFFDKIGLDIASYIRINPEHQDKIVFVDDAINVSAIEGVHCDCLITYSDRPLVLMPADCLGIVVVAKDKNNRQLLSLIHAGRRGVEIGIVSKLITRLMDTNAYGCMPDSFIIGIMPSIDQKKYFVRKEDVLAPDVWKGHAYEGPKGVYLDLLGAALSQIQEQGIRENQIQAYKVDTYEGAIRGETFSSRYATSTNQPEKNGRFMIVASLKRPEVEMQFEHTAGQLQQVSLTQ